MRSIRSMVIIPAAIAACGIVAGCSYHKTVDETTAPAPAPIVETVPAPAAVVPAPEDRSGDLEFDHNYDDRIRVPQWSSGKRRRPTSPRLTNLGVSEPDRQRARNDYATEHIREWPVAESTRTLTVSPARIPRRRKDRGLELRRLARHHPAAAPRGSFDQHWELATDQSRDCAPVTSLPEAAISAVSRRPFSSSLTESPRRNARVCSRTEYLNMNAES